MPSNSAGTELEDLSFDDIALSRRRYDDLIARSAQAGPYAVYAVSTSSRGLSRLQRADGARGVARHTPTAMNGAQ